MAKRASEFGLHICHGGRFINYEAKQHYIGGVFDTKIGLDPDRFGYFDLLDYVKELGYVSWAGLYYRIPRTQTHKVIVNDQSVMEMLSLVDRHAVVTVCVDGGRLGTDMGEGGKGSEGKACDSKVSEARDKESELQSEGLVEEYISEADGESGSGSEGDDESVEDGGLHAFFAGERGSQDEGEENSEDEREELLKEPPAGDDGEGLVETVVETHLGLHDDGDWGDLDNATHSEIDDFINRTCFSDSSEGEDYEPSESELSDVSLRNLDYISDEENLQMRKKLRKVDSVFKLMNEKDGFEADVEHTYQSDYENDEKEFVSDETDSDFDHRLRVKRVVYDPRCDHSKMKPVIGMYFQDGIQCRAGLTTWAIENGRYIHFKAVSKKKLVAKCTLPCPWKLYASYVQANGTFMIRSCSGEHSCPKAMSNKLLTSQWIAGRYLNVYRVRYNMKVKDLHADILERFKVRVPKDRLYKARRMAQEMVRGSVDEHYAMIKNYVAELRRVDPEGRFELLLQPDNTFKALYIGLSALRKGFKASCRPVIGIDGCFLKTYLGGHLLCATGKDGNNGMFPLAWAAVEAENEACWTWFLETLFADLDLGDGSGWTFISDQQKGLQNAVAALAPQAEHRNCARHIYMNWKKVHKGQSLKNLFFRAVYATYEADFKIAVQDMKIESPAAFDDFMARDTTKFCKAFISTYPKSDSVDNNISECFNGYILNAWGKHVIHMLEEIRSSLMVRQVQKFKAMSLVAGKITPNIDKLLEKNLNASAYCVALPAMYDSFQVHYEGDTFVVHVKTGNNGQNGCSCREWDLTGIPCKHAVSAIKYMNRDPLNYVAECFYVSTYLIGYEHGIKPIHGKKMWPQIGGDVVRPPPKTKMPGRPKKK
ncbi:uncharacterized protein LOC130994346 [Salvia miltiorrhiza]|uniref:uncharacterized protein LOC130994346 n=1 Tax=Salvia miltiorrhiza TaxID=226208 RepID=UPI0025AC46D4|nr:uncharacterized protein LOC130994346 [Salvia miltiorrhiza]